MKKIVFRTNDFDISNLPRTRKEQFKDIVKNQYRTLLLFGLFIFLFSIPFLLAYSFRIISNVSLSASLIKKELTNIEINSALIVQTVMFDAINIPCYMIISISLAGFSNIFKNIIFAEGVLFKSDFKNGLKQNLKYFLLSGFIYGAGQLIINLISNYAALSNQIFINILAGFLIVIFYSLVIPMLLFFTVNHTIYEMKISSGFSNSLIATISRFGFCILIGLVFYLLRFVDIIPFPYIKILIHIFFLVLFFPFFYLICILFGFSSYDKLINEIHHPDLFHKGLSSFVNQNDGEKYGQSSFKKH